MEEMEARVVSDNSSEDSVKATDTIRAILGPTAKIFSLADFLRHYVPSLDVASTLDTAMSSSERYLLSHMKISPLESLKPLSKIPETIRRDESLASLVDDVVWCLVQRGARHKRLKQDGRNVLSLGYSVASYYQSSGAQSSVNMPAGVLMMHVNSNVDYCKTSSLYRLIHRMVGDDILRTLLLNTSIFVPMQQHQQDHQQDARSKPRGNYFQLTGPPLRARTTQATSNKSSRKKKVKRESTLKYNDADEETTTSKHLQPHATVSRRSLFYSNAYVPTVGLPAQHILNRPQQHQRPADLLADMVEMKSYSRTAQRKLHKRLLTTGEVICAEICRRHQRCDYTRLLQRYCPLPDCCCQDNKDDAELVDFATACTPAAQVASFLSAVLSRIFPPTFWGTPANLSHFFSHHVDTFVRLRRHEQLGNKTLLHGMRVTKIGWLFGNRKGRISRTDHDAAEKLLLRVLRWVFGGFIIPLLRSTFHVTESEFSGKQTLYYRKPVWSTFRALSMNKLLKNQYTEITKDEAVKRLETQEMGFSRLRLLPKKTGIRPIATLCKRAVIDVRLSGRCSKDNASNDSDEEVDTPLGPARKKRRLKPSTEKPTERRIPPTMPTNTALADTFAVLSYEYSKKEETYGAGLRGLHHFYPRYRRFIEQNRPRDYRAKKLYFGSVDIHHCYDNIDQEHLLGVVGGILSEDDYLIQRYSIVHPFQSMGRIIRRQKKQVGPPETFAPFNSTATALATQYHNTVFVDAVVCVLTKKSKVMEQLREHLTSHLVTTRGRYGDRFLVQTKGIPQGSVLSSMLCNYYYANVESDLLSDHFKPSTTALLEDNDLLARMVDDYILITNDVERLSSFLTKMKRGEPSLGVSINGEKTQVSVDIEYANSDGTLEFQAPSAPDHGRLFPWCGMLLDTSSGEVQVDYSRFYEGKASDGLTANRVGREGEQLMVQMKTFVRPRCLPIFFDSIINSKRVQVINFYQLMVLGAVKTSDYLRTSGMSRTLSTNNSFLLKCIESLIDLAYDLINERLQATVPGAKIDIRRPVSTWLGWQAFNDVFRELPQFSEFALGIGQRLGASEECRSLREAVACALRCIQLEKLLERGAYV